MSAQKIATSRNSKVEVFVDLILNEFLEIQQNKKTIKEFEDTESQAKFKSQIASDVWDHRACFSTKDGKHVEFFAQTTCYKGNKTGKPESNKTYEIRETLVEAISIRSKNSSTNNLFRTLHFTVGPKNYAYGWFSFMKESAFDFSIYLDCDNGDIFDLISTLFVNATTGLAVYKNFKKHLSKDSELSRLVKRTLDELNGWVERGLPVQKLANLQYDLLDTTSNLNFPIADDKLNIDGVGIKTECQSYLYSGNSSDPYIIQTTEMLIQKNPFIKCASEALENWSGFSDFISLIKKRSSSKKEFVRVLWSDAGMYQLLTRRLLIRLISEDGAYIQDLDIPGVTEHNLYVGGMSSEAERGVISHIVDATEQPIQELARNLISRKSKSLTNSMKWFEARNGTNLRPSFDYVTIALKNNGYTCGKPTDRSMFTGYHAELVPKGVNVRPYTNLKLVLNDKKKAIAVIKSKYFREQEFPRRCKEEAFIALSIKYGFEKGTFFQKLNLPLIMFLDIDKDFSPPKYAVARLKAFGWTPVFTIDHLMSLLDEA